MINFKENQMQFLEYALIAIVSVLTLIIHTIIVCFLFLLFGQGELINTYIFYIILMPSGFVAVLNSVSKFYKDEEEN